MMRSVLNCAARLVGELAKIYFEGVRRCAQHIDVRARAEYSGLQALDDDDAHLWVLESEALNRVRQFNVNAQIIRIELELVAIAQRLVLLNIHGERGDRSINI